MLLHVILLLIGLALLVVGGDVLVRGAAGLARAMGVSSLMIGLTVVAFGTSSPELAVNLVAVYRGEGEISFGNIVGSNIANVGLIVGIAALLSPLAIAPGVIRREVPMMLLATLAVLAMAMVGGGADAAWRFTRGDGLVLLLFFGVFVYYTIGDAVRGRGSNLPELAEAAAEIEREPARRRGPLVAVLLVVGGVAGVVGGGHLAVEGAVGVAEALGLSRAVIGLTIIALGTSLPELATSLMALRAGQTDIAVGNVVGSNIFNLLFILALTASLSPAPIPVPAGGGADLLVMAGLSAALLPLAITGRRIARPEGAALLAVYAGYMAWRVVS